MLSNTPSARPANPHLQLKTENNIKQRNRKNIKKINETFIFLCKYFKHKVLTTAITFCLFLNDVIVCLSF